MANRSKRATDPHIHHGNQKDNWISATIGDDLLTGGRGRDTVSYESAVTGAAGVTVSLAVTAPQDTGGSGIDQLSGFENLTGSLNDDVLAGNGGNNVINGLAGADQLFGAAGRDTLIGGDGNDHLDGGKDRDVMRGGAGDDTYVVHQTGDRVVEAAGGGIDTVLSHARATKLAPGVENGQVLAAGKAHMNGNALDNVIQAGTGDNVMNGGKGVDTVSYEFGVTGDEGVRVNLAVQAVRDTGGSGRDRVGNFENVIGSHNDDWLGGNRGDNLLAGLGGNDSLSGGAGNDLLVGGAGSDSLAGGAGNDTFVFAAEADLAADAADADVIQDFVRGADRIDLSGLDANTLLAGNDAFTFIGSDPFSGTDASGQLRYTYDAGTGIGLLSGSTDADADAEFVVQVVGVAELDAADFAL